LISDDISKRDEQIKSMEINPPKEHQNNINSIAKLLNKILPQEWEKARIYIMKKQ
jgi:hypothetical protein